MKLLVLGLAFCLALSAVAADGEEEGASEIHWAYALRELLKNPSLADHVPSEEEDGKYINDLKIILRSAPEENEKKLQNRAPFNPLKLVNMDTPEKLGKYRTSLMAIGSKHLGPESVWYKFKSQKKASRSLAQPFSVAVDIALDDISKFIKEYLRDLQKACRNPNTLTNQKTLSKIRKLSELQESSVNIHKCLSHQTDLIGLKNTKEGKDLDLTDSVLSALIHYSTLISREHTDSAARLVLVAALGKNEECFVEFDKGGSDWASGIKALKNATAVLASMFDRGSLAEVSESLTDDDVKEVYDNFVDLMSDSEAQSTLGGKVAEYVGKLNPKTGSECGKNLIKSMAEVALEIDLQTEGKWTSNLMKIAKILFKT